MTFGDGQKIAVVGNFDPAELRERVERKTHKKVEIVSASPQLKTAKEEKKDSKSNDKSDQKKSKEKEVILILYFLLIAIHSFPHPRHWRFWHCSLSCACCSGFCVGLYFFVLCFTFLLQW